MENIGAFKIRQYSGSNPKKLAQDNMKLKMWVDRTPQADVFSQRAEFMDRL
jgi:hypothetical protein